MKKICINAKRIVASMLCFSMLTWMMPIQLVFASNITGVKPNGNVYNIEGQKYTGSTQFREYQHFELSKGDIANLQYKQGYTKFVNLVDNKVNINGIVNTMQGNNFFNGHAIFVSPSGIIIGASGVLNVGSLTLMAPSQNAYNAFKNAYGNNLDKFDYDSSNANYQSLIKNSSGAIKINGKIFAHENIDIYGREINLGTEKKSAPALIAGVASQEPLTSNQKAEILFNQLVNNSVSNAEEFILKDGKIELVTHKMAEEILTTDNTTLNVNNGLKTVTVGNTTERTIDNDTFQKPSLSDADSKITISNAKIFANKVNISANAESKKEVTKDAIKNYGEAAKKSEDGNETENNNSKDKTTGYEIHESFNGVAPEAEAVVTITNSTIKAEKVSITANATSSTETYIQLLDMIYEKWVTLGLKDLASLTNIGEVIPDFIYSYIDDETKEILQSNHDGSLLQAAITSYFSNKPYAFFDGAKSNAVVNITKSDIYAVDELKITANADSTFKVSTGKLDSKPMFLYGLGASANSAVNIKGSKLATSNKGTIDVNAYSTLNEEIKYDSSNFKSVSEKQTVENPDEEVKSDADKKKEDIKNDLDEKTKASKDDKKEEATEQDTVSAYNIAILNNTVISTSDVVIEDSEINTGDLNIRAIDFNQIELEMKNIAKVGEDSSKTGIAASIILNHVNTDSNINIKNSNIALAGEDKTSGNAKFLAQNINRFSNTAETKVLAEEQTSDISSKELNSIDEGLGLSIYNWLNENLLSTVEDKIAAALDKVNMQLSGSVLWHNAANNSASVIDNSKITATGIDVASNIVDFVVNSAETEASAGNNFGAGAAIIINDQNNTNLAAISNNSNIKADEDVKINATTQLPMNPLELKFGQELEGSDDKELFLGVGFDQGDSGVNAWDAWDAEFIHTELKDLLNVDTIKSTYSMISDKGIKNAIGQNEFSRDGLFNNLAVSEGAGETVAVSGSILVNSIKNDTVALVENSNIEINSGDLVVNSVNSVVNYNGVGKVDFLLESFNDLVGKLKTDDDDEDAPTPKYGLGGSILIDNYTNNAAAKISNSVINVIDGDVNVNSASEEGYISIAVSGASAGKLAINGSVNVQNIDGKTSATIENKSDINAVNVNVNAGEGTISSKATGDDDPIEVDEDTKELKTNDERSAKDGILNITFLGVNSTQEEETDDKNQSGSSGVSVGASVNVANIDKVVEASVDDSKLKAVKDVTVKGNTISRKVDVLLAGAFAGGVSVKDDEDEKKEISETKNVGNWKDAVEKSKDDDKDVLSIQKDFDENNSAKEAAKETKDNEGLKAANNNVDSDGKEADNSSSEGNAKSLSESDNLIGENKQADATTAQSNFSAAIAGSVDVTTDSTIVTAKVTNSEIVSGQDINIEANNDTFVIDINGGLAKSGNIAAGAGVNIYRNLTATNAFIENSNINGNNELNVLSNADIELIDVTAGIGAATADDKDDKGAKVAVGGSFAWNTLKNSVISEIKNSVINGNGSDIALKATDNSHIWNITGGVAFTKGSKNSTGVGAGIAATVDLSSKNIVAQISDSTLNNVKDVIIGADLSQDFNTVAVASALATGSKSSFNFDGALNTEVNTNNVIAKAVNSEITSSGDVSIKANSELENMSLAGGLSFSTSESGAGVGIGAIVNINNSNITATADNLNVKKSNSVDISANSSEDLKLLAVNMGLQTGGAHAINVNGISNVFISNVVANAINNSVLNSNGNIDISSMYNNKNQGITIVAEVSKDGVAIGANLVGNVYNNGISAIVGKDTSINSNGGVNIIANAVEFMNLIPVGASVSVTGKAAVAANINANVLKDNVEALLEGDIENSSSVSVNAQDETTIYTRGGNISIAPSGSSVGGSVNVDVLNKNVKAQIKDADVKSSGEVSVAASAVNSFGGTKNADGSYVSQDVADAGKYTSGNLDENDNFANWNMFYDLSGGSKASVSGTVVTKIVNDTVIADILNSNIKAGSLTVKSIDYSIVNAIIGKISIGGKASIGANVFVFSGDTTVNASVSNGSTLQIDNEITVASSSVKESTLVNVAGSGAGKVAINGSAVANVINDNVSAVIDNGVVANADSVNVFANSVNDLKGAVLSVAGSGTASIGAIVYINKQNSDINAGIKESNINVLKDVTVYADSEDVFNVALINIAVSGHAGIGGMGVLNFIDSDVYATVDNTTLTSKSGKVDVIAERGFNRNQSGKSNIFRNWFKDTSAFKESKSVGDNDIAKLIPLVNVLNIGGAGTGAGIAATIISNNIVGNVLAEVKTSQVSTAQGLNVIANHYFVNYDAIASVAAARTGAGISAVGVVNLLENNLTSQIVDSTIIAGGVDVESLSSMDLNQLVISGAGAGTGAAVNATVDYNNINDKVHSYITNSTINGNTKVDAQHVIEINNILLAGSVAGTGATVTVIPVLNSYTGETVAEINKGSDINNGKISVNAQDYIDNFSAVAGVSVAGTGASASGYAIRNDYANRVIADIEGSILNTQNNVNITSASVLDSTNALISGGIAGVGASITVNVIINDIESDVSSSIADTNIKNAGAIYLSANENKKDKIDNIAGSVSITGVGASASVNSIFNFYKNTTKAYVDNTEIAKAASLTTKVFGDRDIQNHNIGATAAGVGAAILANSIVNQVDSKVIAYIDSKDKNINIDNALVVNAESKTLALNESGVVSLAGLGVGAGANIGLHEFNDLAKAEILTGSNGQITAGSTSVLSNAVYGIENNNLSVTAGFGAIAGDVAIITLGKRSDIYLDSEKGANVDDAVGTVKDVYAKFANDNKFNPAGSNDPETGSIARVNANLKTTGNVDITSSSKLKGRNSEELTLKNTVAQVGGNTASVGVKSVKLSNNTLAEISGGKVESSNGDVSVNANSSNNVKIENVSVQVGGLTISGAAGIYNNSAETLARINNADVNSNNVNITSNSANKSSIDNHSAILALANAGFSISDNKDKNHSYAIVSGNSNINTGNLNIRSTGSTNLKSELETFTVSGYSLQFLTNNTYADSITKAMIENATGELNVSGLNIIADTGSIETIAKSNLTNVSLAGLTVANSGAYVNAEMSAGINSPSGLIINNSGKTKILSGVKSNNNNQSAEIKATAQIKSLGAGAISGGVADATARNKANVNAKLVANEHNADSLVVKTMMNQRGIANIDSQSYGLLTVSSSDIDSLVQGKLGIDVSGKNIIANDATFTAINNSTNNVDLKTVSGSALNISVQNLVSNMDTNTVLNIGGELGAKDVIISTDTERYSKVDYSSQGYGGVSIGYTNVKNNVKGSSILNLDGYTSNPEKAGTISVNHKSKNTHDSVSNSVSGGLVAVDSMDVSGIFNTSTVMNVKNSDINTNGNISFNVENANIIEDSSKSTSGGVISLAKNVTTHTYNSASELNIINSEIKSAKDIDLTTFASTKNSEGNYIDYAGKGGGFIAGVTVELTNNVIQSSKISVDNSKIHADKNLVATAKTGSSIRQQIQTKAGGFIATPKNINTLNVLNDNEINIYGNSSVMNAGSNLVLNLDSSNDLGVRSESNASSFGFKDPVAKSYLNFVVNNRLNNNGSISGEEYVDINLMESSVNNLMQYAHSESKAAVATSTEDGHILKQINNNITVGDGGEISTGKNMEITYSVGKGVTSSEVSWKNTSYGLFGIPITVSGRKSNVESSNNATMNLNGSGNINAGRRNNKYMKVNADGTIDSSTRGFEDSEYMVTSGEGLTAEEIKAQTINSIQVDIDEIDSTIKNIDSQIPDLTAQRDSASQLAEEHRNELNTLKGYVDNDYEVVDETGLNSAIVGKIISERGNDADDAYILNAYKTEIENIDARNSALYEANANSTVDYTLESDPTFVEFLDKYTFEQFVLDSGKTFEGSTQAEIDQAKQTAQTEFNTRISQLKSSFNSEKANMTTINPDYEYKEYTYTVTGQDASGNNVTQEFKYIVASRSDAYSVLETDQAELDNQVAGFDKQLNSNAQLKANMLAEKSIYKERLTEAQNRDYAGVAGGEAIVFSPVKTNVSTIRIDGIDKSNIHSMDKFKTTPAGMEIENYSMKSLIFNDIDLSTPGLTKLYVNGQEQAITETTNKVTGIIINNHYDASNPFVTSGIVPNIEFNGHIRANNDAELFVRAESGNINLVNKSGMDINSSKTQLLALQGDVNVLFDSASNPKFNLRSQDKIFAGNDINISAREVQIDGKLRAGLADRNVTITDDMLSNLTVDTLTGETNLVDLGGNSVSPYFNDVNNIKAIYKDGKIYLFDVRQSNGNINISANNSDISGTIKQNTGFRNIVITNNTNKEIVIGDISNVTNDSTKLAVIGNEVELANAEVKNGNNATISIVSDGKVTLYRTIKNGLHNNEFAEPEDAKLSIKSNNGVDILEFKPQYNGEIISPYAINTIGDVSITNSVGGMKIENAVNTQKGNIDITNKSGDIVIGKNIDTVETFVGTKEGNITITQSNGSILNGVIDNTANNHSTDDINNPNNAYKTLISANGDLTIAVKDGDIGATSHENAGVSINADTRDYTESLNVNVSGNLVATALNSTKSDERLINIRAKQSDLNIVNINADGNVILTAADTDSANNGYNVLNALEEQGTNVRGQNVSIIASDTIGSSDKQFYVESISEGADGKYSASLYAKNDINLEIETDAKTGVQFHQILSKQGDLNIGLSEDTTISELVSTKGINVVQSAQNLTIYSIGKLIAEDSPYATMDDIFASNTVSENNQWTPEYINIKVLDAVDTAERSDSNLKIYTAWIKGNQENVYPDNSRQADVTLMADNVWAGSDKAPSPIVSNPYYPSNDFTENSYSNELTGTQNPVKLNAEGFNAYGDGSELTFDIVGVDKDTVDSIVAESQRDNYSELKTLKDVPLEFTNPNVPKGLSNAHTNNVILSVNDYTDTNRGVVVDTLYANKAYVDTNDEKFTLNDGQINHYGQIQNGGGYKTVVVVDNDQRRIVDNADIQLYTEKTGSFNLKLDNSINSHTSAPAVYYNPRKLVNDYHSTYNFVEDAYKLDVINQKNIPIHKSLQQRAIQGNEAKPRKDVYITENNLNNRGGISSDVRIYNISTSSALVENGKNFKKGNKIDFKLIIDGEDNYVKAKVINVKDGKAQLEFINIPESTANKLRYKYMQADSEGEKLSNNND